MALYFLILHHFLELRIKAKQFIKKIFVVPKKQLSYYMPPSSTLFVHSRRTIGRFAVISISREKHNMCIFVGVYCWNRRYLHCLKNTTNSIVFINYPKSQQGDYVLPSFPNEKALCNSWCD